MAWSKCHLSTRRALPNFGRPNQVVALIPDHGVDGHVGVRLLGDLLQQPAVDHVGHVRSLLRVHGAALARPVDPHGLHRVLLLPLVHAEDLLVHQGAFIRA